MTKFADSARQDQIAWRKRALPHEPRGLHRGRQYEHVLTGSRWLMNVWRPMAGDLPVYLLENHVQAHSARHNLCSSWILTANLYFPFRGRDGRGLLAGFLRERAHPDIVSVESVDLEYEARDTKLRPSSLLGEEQGSRGTHQTSPDVAFGITTPSGAGLVLVESKYTEHSFYECSGHRKKPAGREPNPDRGRCANFEAVIGDPKAQCHLVTWGRRYWDYLDFKQDYARQVSYCPAATGAYQLFRQQALAEAYVAKGQWHLVVSAVAYDERNTGLFNVIRLQAGRGDARSEWRKLLDLRAPFVTFTHQSWVAWVRGHGGALWADWAAYVQDRYGL